MKRRCSCGGFLAAQHKERPGPARRWQGVVERASLREDDLNQVQRDSLSPRTGCGAGHPQRKPPSAGSEAILPCGRGGMTGGAHAAMTCDGARWPHHSADGRTGRIAG